MHIARLRLPLLMLALLIPAVLATAGCSSATTTTAGVTTTAGGTTVTTAGTSAQPPATTSPGAAGTSSAQNTTVTVALNADEKVFVKGIVDAVDKRKDVMDELGQLSLDAQNLSADQVAKLGADVTALQAWSDEAAKVEAPAGSALVPVAFGYKQMVNTLLAAATQLRDAATAKDATRLTVAAATVSSAFQLYQTVTKQLGPLIQSL